MLWTGHCIGVFTLLHNKQNISNDKRIKCFECNVHYGKTYLETHIKAIHEKTEYFECKACFHLLSSSLSAELKPFL